VSQIKASVIVCAYNEEKTLDGCLESLLPQLYKKTMFELIVIDNESTDRTSHIVERYFEDNHREINFSFFRIKHLSLSSARNTGISYAKGEYIVFLDADTKVSKNWLMELLDGFNSKNVDMVSGTIEVLNTNNIVAVFLNSAYYKPSLSTSSSKIIGANMAFRKRVFSITGGFYENLGYRGDETCVINSYLLSNPNAREVNRPQAIVYHMLEGTYLKSLKNRFVEGKSGAILFRIYGRRYQFPQTIVLRFINVLFIPFCLLYFMFSENDFLFFFVCLLVLARYLSKYRFFISSFKHTNREISVGYAFFSQLYLIMAFFSIDFGYVYGIFTNLFRGSELRNARIGVVLNSREYGVV